MDKEVIKNRKLQSEVMLKLNNLCGENYDNLRILLRKYFELSSKLNGCSCEHQIWCNLEIYKDIFDHHTYYECECLECGLIYNGLKKEFDNCIFPPNFHNHNELSNYILRLRDAYFAYCECTDDVNLLSDLIVNDIEVVNFIEGRKKI